MKFSSLFEGLLQVLLLLVLLWSPPPVQAETPIHITFARNELGKFPPDWGSRDSSAPDVYSVRAEAGRRFLHAEAKGTSIQIAYEQKWPLKDFPMLRWQWRAVLFPSSSNEREKSGDDSVLGLYVVFGKWPFIKSLKYIWSDTLPVGATFNSPFSKSSKLIVLRSGRAQAGMWVQETRNVLADYQQFLGDSDKNPTAEGIAVLTDADNTNSQAIGDYADIEAFAQPGRTKPNP
jgi:hypothetical protein